jgi:hypothetical protein
VLYIIISILTDIVTLSSRHDLNQNICEMVSLKMSFKFVHNGTSVAYLPCLAHKMKLIERFDTFLFCPCIVFLASENPPFHEHRSFSEFKTFLRVLIIHY